MWHRNLFKCVMGCPCVLKYFESFFFYVTSFILSRRYAGCCKKYDLNWSVFLKTADYMYTVEGPHCTYSTECAIEGRLWWVQDLHLVTRKKQCKCCTHSLRKRWLRSSGSHSADGKQRQTCRIWLQPTTTSTSRLMQRSQN